MQILLLSGHSADTCVDGLLFKNHFLAGKAVFLALKRFFSGPLALFGV
jgi:hypothetical protein